MSIKAARWLVLHLSFVILTFGGKLGLSLGQSLPCLSCPFVSGCGGICYLRLLQSPIGGLGMSWSAIFTARGLAALGSLLIFTILVALFGQSWCGWVCPFGLVQDYAARLRNKLRIRQAQFSKRSLKIIRAVKYLLFAYLLAGPILVAIGLGHPDLTMPFCNICPVKLIMPLLTGNTAYLSLDFTNPVLLTQSILLTVFSGLVLVGMFFRHRFFCLLCPMSVLIGLFKPISLTNLVKSTTACRNCGNCRRVCPAGIDKTCDTFLPNNLLIGESPSIPSSNFPASPKTSVCIRSIGCQGCFDCVQCCSTDGALSIKIGPWKLFSSSRAYAAAFGLSKRPWPYLLAK
ncbi:MAG: 4Fe-4S binding protein, partial [Deltaproteobacteria bacterium]|nr:4Fe-4S binding protein [Deltaproteobacteria bacterium]